MTGLSRLMALAAVGGLALLGMSKEAWADGPSPAACSTVWLPSAQAPSRDGSDETGAPVVGAVFPRWGMTRRTR
jgi:hypothetical protein